MSPDKQIAAHHVLRGEHVLIHGPGGTGKSFLIAWLRKALIEIGKRPAVTATTGVAAVHVFSPYPPPTRRDDDADYNFDKDDSKCNVDTDGPVSATTLIVDAVSMLSSHKFEKLNERIQHLRRDERFLGGLQAVVVGDFLQLPPDCSTSGDATSVSTAAPHLHLYKRNLPANQHNQRMLGRLLDSKPAPRYAQDWFHPDNERFPHARETMLKHATQKTP
ncbi:hypothetical protein BCR44DRAFT_59199 [Catenaria anguillulae PL171]|uniref:ATP-dependent DNA helicase n=1 Tax=Catenaria anguillulae PL171 TaxID=765915 RepID=A0A1Y2HD53_9FUNG|nr:hypothetical protein BCR44DRAFT_59199 [Catenaria anguillulae PL171]